MNLYTYKMPIKDGKVKFYQIKDEIRILGIDDGPFNFQQDKKNSSGNLNWYTLISDKKTLLIGAIFRGGQWLDGLLKEEIEIDGLNVTEKIIAMVKKTRHKDLRIIMLDGLTFAGFNLADIGEIFEKTSLPVIVIIRKIPEFEQIKKALENLEPEKRKRALKCIEKAGKPERVETKKGKYIYIQKKGLKLKDARKIVKLSATRSLIPEPIRVAHLIASGIILGESRGGA